MIGGGAHWLTLDRVDRLSLLAPAAIAANGEAPAFRAPRTGFLRGGVALSIRCQLQMG